MSDTQALLTKITALRQRLEQAQGLAREATSAAAALSSDDLAQLDALQRRAAAAAEHDALVDSTLRPLDAAAAAVEAALPVRLTARARHVLERGRELLTRLRGMGDLLEPGASSTPIDGEPPLARLYRQTVAMTDTTLRMVQALPAAPSAQLRMCEGLEAILESVAQRLAVLAGALARGRQEEARITRVAGLLAAVAAGQPIDLSALGALAAELVNEAQDSAPLRILHAPAEEPARFVACHSLTVAQIVARVVRYDPELRGGAPEAVLAALVHDAGMLRVPVEVLARAGPLADEQRRAVEAHTRIGPDLLRRLWPGATWLTEAAAGHHERMDGTGYPSGLRDVQLSPLTRLVAICDVYAALVAPRPHRPARDTRTALTDTLLLAEQGALDRLQTERLLQLSFYPVGAAVELADGSVGLVVATHVGRRELTSPARPVVALLVDAQGRPLPSPVHLDLAQCEGRSVVRSLSPQERCQLLGARYPEWA
jgi:HD-GYP domain-containing protein (c-di-GMP phosphodiesterase class II)